MTSTGPSETFVTFLRDHRDEILAEWERRVGTRLVGAADFKCKEIVFSVDTIKHKAPHREFYTATVCLDGDDWKWASAEPATERWGSLQ